jgi:hypothetical protein
MSPTIGAIRTCSICGSRFRPALCWLPPNAVYCGKFCADRAERAARPAKAAPVPVDAGPVTEPTA